MALIEALHWTLPPGVRAVCSTRVGGVSSPPFDSFNLGSHVGDNPRSVLANRQRFTTQLGTARPVFLQQIHGVEVVMLERDTPDGVVADACLALESDLACTIMVADCLPILLTDRHGRAVAAAHAGWRGLVHGVVDNTLAQMCKQACVSPSDVLVWLGPCIGPSAFEVGDDVRDAFLAHDPLAAEHFKAREQHRGKWFADLPGLARQRLACLGVHAISGNDGSASWCTVHQSSRFFSYRRDGITGRFAACIWINR